MHQSEIRDLGVARRMMGGASALALCLMIQAVSTGIAYAQNAPEPGNANADSAQGDAQSQGMKAEEVVVTGSRIARPGVTAPTPVTALSGRDIQAQAPTTLADTLHSIPSFVSTNSPENSQITTTTRGGASADLRGLGRTLVLVDGRRFVASGASNVVDLKDIPTLLISRVDVVTGGASAAWGSDAVAGVVNFIMRKDIEGLETSFHYGISDHGDNEEFGSSVALGDSYLNGRLRLSFGADYVKNYGAGNQYTRGWGQKEFQLLTNPTLTNGQPQYIISPNVHPATLTPGGLIVSGPLKGTAFNTDGSTSQFQYGTVYGPLMVGGGNVGQNLTNATLLEVPIEAFSSLSRAQFDLTPTTQLYAEYSYDTNDSGGFTQQPRDAGTLVIQQTNAYLPASVRQAMVQNNLTTITVGRVNNDTGAVIARNDNSLERIVTGATGNIGSDWNWDAYFQYGRNTLNTTAGPNNRITANYTRAIDAVAVTPANVGTTGLAVGSVVCRSTLLDPGNGCIPINIFGDGNAKINSYAFAKSYATLVTTETVASARISGDLFPTWAGTVSVATGAEYRKETATGTADPISTQVQPSGSIGAFTLANFSAIQGEYDLWEIFGEANVPLLHEQFLSKELDLNGAIRRTEYSLSGPVVTWKAGLNWEVTDEIRLRTTRSRDIRAPNLTELYQNGGSSFTNIFDPALGQTVQVRELTLGNPNLKPEGAWTWTGGAVYQPEWFPGFDATVDYYDIRINGAISSISTNLTSQLCFAGQTAYCQTIVFAPNGTIDHTVRKTLNLNSMKTAGVDVEANYHFSIDAGDISLRLLGTYVGTYIITTTSGPTNYVGKVSNFNRTPGMPRLTMVGDVVFNDDDNRVDLQARLVGNGKFDPSLSVGAGANTINVNDVPAFVYLNLNVSHNLTLWDGKTQIFGVINNLLDTAPPMVPSGTVGGANETSTNPTFYDVIGRTFKIGFRATF